MTPEQADQLHAWLASLDARQLWLLWRWVTLEAVTRTEAEAGIVRRKAAGK